MVTRSRARGALYIVIAGIVAFSVTTSSAAFADDYPTWGDVQNARQNQADTEAAINQLEGLIADLEAQAAELGKQAQIKAEAYNVARDALDAASAKAQKLQDQADAASDRAADSARKAGQLVAQLARTGGGNLGMSLFVSKDADSLLNKLGTMSKVTEQATLIYRQATLDKNLAQALTDQARVAEKKRKTLKSAAETALAAAQAASADAQAKVDAQKATADTMYAQLASLKGTTAETEQGYLAGVAWEAAQEAVKNPPPDAPPVNPEPPAPNGSAVSIAIDYAYAQLGKPYIFGGSGPDGYDCSGLTKQAYAAAGVYIGTHSSNNQYNLMAAQGRLVPLSQMVAGDLLWYSDGGDPGGDKYHVTLYIGDGQMIEAPYEGQPVRIRPVRYGDLVPYAGRPTP